MLFGAKVEFKLDYATAVSDYQHVTVMVYLAVWESATSPECKTC